MNTAKVVETRDKDGNHYSWVWHCPGCDSVHSCNDRWTFNGNVDAPTFSPSILVHEYIVPETGKVYQPRCHSFVKDGKISYCGDTTNGYANQTLELPAFRDKHPGWSE